MDLVLFGPTGDDVVTITAVIALVVVVKIFVNSVCSVLFFCCLLSWGAKGAKGEKKKLHSRQ